MRLLLTNDDGYGAKGLEKLATALSLDHEVWIFAPDRERSGVSHALTMTAPGRVKELGQRRYTCSGTPADCVVLAMLGILGLQPDAVVSGINRGPNLGTDIVYSGTCAAAREAVLAGVPGLAVSCAGKSESLHYEAAAAFVRKNLEKLLSYANAETFINVNAPDSEDENLEARWCSPCERNYGNGLRSFDAPDGYHYHFLLASNADSHGSSESDFQAVSDGLISVSPILVQPQAPTSLPLGRKFC